LSLAPSKDYTRDAVFSVEHQEHPLSCTVVAVAFLVKFVLNWPTGPQLEEQKDGRQPRMVKLFTVT